MAANKSTPTTTSLLKKEPRKRINSKLAKRAVNTEQAKKRANCEEAKKRANSEEAKKRANSEQAKRADSIQPKKKVRSEPPKKKVNSVQRKNKVHSKPPVKRVVSKRPAKKVNPRAVYTKKLVLALVVLLAEVLVCISQIVLGVWIHIFVENVSAGAFWASILLLIGALVSLQGIIFTYGRRRMLAMGVMMQVIGIVMALIGAGIESTVASLISGVDFDQCSYSSSGQANCTEELACDAVQLSYPKSCYCCYLTEERFSPCYFRAVSLFEAPSMYGGVDSCSQVSGEYLSLLWASAGFCLLCSIFGILAAMVTYSYRKVVISKARERVITTTATSPMLPHRTQPEGGAKPSSSSSGPSTSGAVNLDIPVPAPRNSLVRSSSSSIVETSLPQPSPPKSSTLPKRQKRRAPDVPTAQGSTTDSGPCSLTEMVVIRPKKVSTTQSRPTTESTPQSLRTLLRPSSEERPRSMEVRHNPAVRTSRSSCNIRGEASERPAASAESTSLPSDSPRRVIPVRPADNQHNRLSRTERDLDRSQDSQGHTLATSTPDPADSPATTSSNAARSGDTPGSSGSPAGAVGYTKEVVKAKRKSHKKNPAPKPPHLLQGAMALPTPLQDLPPVTPVPPIPQIPQSPPPPFVPNPPPSPPPSPPPFTASAPMHYHHPHHHHPSPVTNIHLTLHTTPMGTNVQMPMGGQNGYLFQNQPSAPYL